MMNQSTRLLCLFLFFLFFTVLQGFCDESPPADTRSLDSVTLHLKWKHQFQFAGYYAALEKGFYKDAGLDVTLIEGNPDKESTRQVLTGEADFGIAMSDLISLRAQGQPVVALASIFQHSPTILLAPKRNGIENIHDLQGKRIMLEDHSDELLGYLESEGIPAHKLILYPHEYDINRLVSGDMDAISAYSTDEPFLLLESGIEYSTFTPRAVGIDFYGDILFTSEQQVKKHPERVAAFVDASLKGWEYALENPDEIIDLILSKYSTRHSREHLQFEAMMSERLIMPDVVELGYMNPGRWRSISELFKQMNLIPADFTLDGFIYNRTPPQNLGWLYFSLLGAVVCAALAFFLVARFYNLNHALKWEITERQKTIDQLNEAHDQIHTLQGIIPICMHCKGIRDDKGYWEKLETYISDHSDVTFSHGICEKCLQKYYPKYSAD